MTNEQVDRAVQHLCEQLHVAIRLKGSEALPPNAKDIGFDAAAVMNRARKRPATGGHPDRRNIIRAVGRARASVVSS